MINSQMKNYNYQAYSKKLNEYGQPILSETKGIIKMAINLSSQALDENSLYSDAQYIGLTFDAIDDKYVIEFGEEKLKVLYVNPFGRYKQVFLSRM